MQWKASAVHTPCSQLHLLQGQRTFEGRLQGRPAQALPAALLLKARVLPSMKPSASRCSLAGHLRSSTNPASSLFDGMISYLLRAKPSLPLSPTPGKRCHPKLGIKRAAGPSPRANVKASLFLSD